MGLLYGDKKMSNLAEGADALMQGPMYATHPPTDTPYIQLRQQD